ncbi:ferric reductase-like transmembrane domain-containing protein [Arthrobacter sp. NPDC090010]|uniref:ferredoxin reductase family protein n=1 Tax=Arthrobacter sp. NPDC090010 TaxID=3363942 RepID=UPI0037F8BDB1
MDTIADPAWRLAPAGRRDTERRPDYRRALRRRLFSADLAVVLCWASTAFAVSLYLLSGGLADLKTAADAVNGIGIVAGLAGTNLILIMVLLAARIPWLDRAVGQDVVMAWHRRLGKPVLYLILAHAVLLTVGYALRDRIDVVAETVAFFSSTDLVYGYLAFALLLAVVVTSLLAVRRRLSYELWHLTHLLSYAAVLLALPHQLSIGGVLAQGTVQRIYWIGLYVVAYGAILWFRIVKPLLLSARHGLRVARVEQHAPDVVSLHLSGRGLDSLGVRGGQYANWRFLSARDWWHAHPLSFSAVPADGSLRLTVRTAGSGTHALSRVRPGTRVLFEGPYGLFTRDARSSPRVAMVAAGIGVTPLRALLEDLNPSPGEATVLLRASTESQLYLLDEMEALCQSSGTAQYADLGARSEVRSPWLSAASVARGVSLDSVFPRLKDSDLYICGPSEWAESVAQDAVEAGLKDHQIHVERFDW